MEGIPRAGGGVGGIGGGVGAEGGGVGAGGGAAFGEILRSRGARSLEEFWRCSGRASTSLGAGGGGVIGRFTSGDALRSGVLGTIRMVDAVERAVPFPLTTGAAALPLVFGGGVDGLRSGAGVVAGGGGGGGVVVRSSAVALTAGRCCCAGAGETVRGGEGAGERETCDGDKESLFTSKVSCLFSFWLAIPLVWVDAAVVVTTGAGAAGARWGVGVALVEGGTAGCGEHRAAWSGVAALTAFGTVAVETVVAFSGSTWGLRIARSSESEEFVSDPLELFPFFPAPPLFSLLIPHPMATEVGDAPVSSES